MRLTLRREVETGNLKFEGIVTMEAMGRYIGRLDDVDRALFNMDMTDASAADVLLTLEMLFRRFGEFKIADSQTARPSV